MSFAAVLMLTVGAEDPSSYVLRYAGLTLIGAVVGVLVTTVLFPPLQLTQAVEQIARTRDMLAVHLEAMAARLACDRVPSPAEERRWMAVLGPELDRCAGSRPSSSGRGGPTRGPPRASRWQEAAARIRAESRVLDRVAVLIDDLTALVSNCGRTVAATRPTSAPPSCSAMPSRRSPACCGTPTTPATGQRPTRGPSR